MKPTNLPMSGKVVQPAELPTMEPTMQYFFYPGYDGFLADAGRFRERKCAICNTTTIVERNQTGPRSYAGAMAVHFGRLRAEDIPPHDLFYCPHAAKAWHQEAGELAKERDNTASPTLRAIINSDLQTLISRHLKSK